jgi:hypothetical protein
MALHWESQDEFQKWVMPIGDPSTNLMRSIGRNLIIENLETLFRERERFGEALENLKNAGFGGDPPNKNPEGLKEVRSLLFDLVFSGEDLLAHHKRLAESRWAKDFISEKDIVEHLDRYETDVRKIADLMEAAGNLWQGFYEIVLQPENFLEVDLPDSLEIDFASARNLFSVGFDDVGVLIAGRGLEGVLREIARRKQLRFGATGNEKPAWEADFRDIVEILYRARWKKGGTRLIDQPTKALLDYVRTIRNSHAHPKSAHDEPNYREQAILIASKANSLWKKATQKEAKLASRKIKRDW